jgi:predicted nucleic-acid-binding Zn-ribbon protein
VKTKFSPLSGVCNVRENFEKEAFAASTNSKIFFKIINNENYKVTSVNCQMSNLQICIEVAAHLCV